MRHSHLLSLRLLHCSSEEIGYRIERVLRVKIDSILALRPILQEKEQLKSCIESSDPQKDLSSFKNATINQSSDQYILWFVIIASFGL